MKKLLLILLCLVFLFFSCSDNKSVPGLFNPKNLRTQHFKINPNTDTTLFGLRGGLFSIEKGSFSGNGPVEIEIKEAYSPAEIVYAGLTTESDGQLLESGGMVYFNAKRNGKQVKLIKPVSISIPTNYVNKEMKVFKGEEKADGTVNWTDPEPIDSSINISPIDTGKVLFEIKCASCHNLYKETTGPSLLFVEERINDRNVLRSFIRNPAQTMQENVYFQCQKAKYGSMMTAFPDLSDRDIDLILDYIKNESEKRPDLKPAYEDGEGGLPLTDTSSLSSCLSAPCGFDTIYVDTTKYEYAIDNMMDLHEEATKEDSMDYLYKKPDSLEKAMRTGGFVDILPTDGRYNFRIKTLGWFNVDAFYEGMKGTEIVDLFVKVDFEEPQKIEVHVFFPAKKILTVGTCHKEDNLFHFEKYKGQIPLFLNDEAVVIGFISLKEKIYYGISSFKVGKQQTISLHIEESTEEKLSAAFKEMKLDGVDLDIITKKRVIVPRNCMDSVKKDAATK
ncbi:MAG: cytochrome c [Chitinophagaceae bacterium]